MAGLTTKLGPLLLSGLNSPAVSNKFLAVQVLNNKLSAANIFSKSSGQLEERMKPWDYKKYGYNYACQIMEGTTKRFNDNTKIIVVEGPPGLNKGKFCQELADELDMVYVPGPTMDQYYTNLYGYDLRDLDWQFNYPKNKSYDEKKFAQDPLAQNGGLDRMQDALQFIRARTYNELLAHLFNTGRGIVTEKCPHSEYVFTEAAYNMGWIDPTSRTKYHKIRKMVLQYSLKPHVIIYLDAPVDVVQAKIRERANTTHPWEKNSPVFENTSYLKMLYETLMKREYLKQAAISSKVLMYDWSDGGDTEVVVEDLERLQLEYFDKYDKQQADWRMFKEDNYSLARRRYTDRKWVNFCFSHLAYMEAFRIEPSNVELLDWTDTAVKLPGNVRYDDVIDVGEPKEQCEVSLLSEQQPFCYNLSRTFLHDNAALEAYFHERERRRQAGDANWWNWK